MTRCKTPAGRLRRALDRVRAPGDSIPAGRAAAHSALIALWGLGMGAMAKALDLMPANALPNFLQVLDLGNFFSGMAVWLALCVGIAVRSRTPQRAGLNCLLFLAGMLASYYACTRWFAGFFPRSYAMLWVGVTAVSPLLAAVVWYAKGEGAVAAALAAGVLGVLLNQALAFGWLYVDVRGQGLELLVWFAVLALFYRSPRQTAGLAALSIPIAILWRLISPFSML